jgi:hypothetical protein
MTSEKIPCFRTHFPCYAARLSLFVDIGNFAETTDFTIRSDGEQLSLSETQILQY